MWLLKNLLKLTNDYSVVLNGMYVIYLQQDKVFPHVPVSHGLSNEYVIRVIIPFLLRCFDVYALNGIILQQQTSIRVYFAQNTNVIISILTVLLWRTYTLWKKWVGYETVHCEQASANSDPETHHQKMLIHLHVMTASANIHSKFMKLFCIL